MSVLSVIEACAFASTTLVAIWPLKANTEPPPEKLPPEASTVLVADARICACSAAATVTPSAVTWALSIVAETSARTSLRTIRMPMARALESKRLPMFG